MKDWEVIKELMADPRKVFENEDGQRLSFFNRHLSFFDKEMNFVDTYSFVFRNTHNWHLVRQPVTWQEAIEAWGEGHTIKKCFPNSEQTYPSGTTIHLTKNDVVNGIWYVED